MNVEGKVLIVGQAGQYNLEAFVSNGFSQIGWRVSRFNIYEEILPVRELQSYLRFVVTRSFRSHKAVDFLSRINERIYSRIQRQKPDLLLVFKGELFPPKMATRISRDLGVRTALWFPDDPRFVNSLLSKIASSFELVISSAKSSIQALQQLGVREILHLPFACDPSFHRSLERAKTFDVTFVGSYYPERCRVLSKLTSFNLRIWGPRWNLPWIPRELRKCVMKTDSFGENLIEILNRSKITINIHHESDLGVLGKTNMRVFETSGCGAFQLSDQPEGIHESFLPDREIVCYQSPEELAPMVDRFLKSEEERISIAGAAQKRAYSDHTYENRVKTVVERMT